MKILLLAFLAMGGLPVEPIMQVDDTRAYTGDLYLSYPYQGLYRNGKLYVTEEGKPVLMFDQNGFVQFIGSIGGAREEFKQQPVSLAIRGDKLLIGERYGRSHSLFTPDGAFIKKEAAEPRLEYLADGTRFQRLHFEEAFKRRFVLKNLDAGWLLGTLEDDTGIGFHLSSASPLRLDADHILIAKPRGAFEIYDRKGTLVTQREVPLELFKREIERDPFGDAILKHRPRRIKYYRYGQPMFDVAVESAEHIWFLAGKEDSLTEDDRKPMEVTLFRMSLKTGKISFKRQLPIILWNITIADGHLVLLSQEDAVIQVYALAQIRQALGE